MDDVDPSEYGGEPKDGGDEQQDEVGGGEEAPPGEGDEGGLGGEGDWNQEEMDSDYDRNQKGWGGRGRRGRGGFSPRGFGGPGPGRGFGGRGFGPPGKTGQKGKAWPLGYYSFIHCCRSVSTRPWFRPEGSSWP